MEPTVKALGQLPCGTCLQRKPWLCPSEPCAFRAVPRSTWSLAAANHTACTVHKSEVLSFTGSSSREACLELVVHQLPMLKAVSWRSDSIMGLGRKASVSSLPSLPVYRQQEAEEPGNGENGIWPGSATASSALLLPQVHWCCQVKLNMF